MVKVIPGRGLEGLSLKGDSALDAVVLMTK